MSYTASSPYDTSYTFPNVTSGDLSFTSIVSTEVDYGSFNSFTDNAPFPYAISTPINLLNPNAGLFGMEWGGFTAGVNAPNSSTTFTVNYDVAVTDPTEAITSLQQLYVFDSNIANDPNATATATEQAYDSAGDLVATMTWSSASPTASTTVNLATGYQQLHIVLTVNETIGAAGTNSAIDISTIDQSFGQTQLPQLGSISSTVFCDSNGNGVQNSGESGMAGITVELLNASGTQVLATTTTNASGGYSFGNLAAGTYETEVIAPAGDSFTTPGNGVDSGITLAAGATDTVAAAGIYMPAVFNIHVYYDANDNGVQDSGDSNLAGVTVTLLTGSGAPTGQAATTDANGNVSFAGLTPGSYEVQVATPTGDVVTQSTNVMTPVTLESCGTASAVEGVFIGTVGGGGSSGTPAVSIVKSVTSVGGTAGDPAATYAGEVIAYQVVVTNSGTEALTNVVVTDPTLGTTLGTVASLGVGDSVTYAAAQTVTQAEIDNGGPVTNTATVTDDQTSLQSSTASTNVTQLPGVSIVKSVTSVGGTAGDPAATYAGEVIDYNVVVSNTGNETLTNVVVTDPTLGTTLGTLATLAVGASATYTTSQIVTQAEIDNGGPVSNTATVTDNQTGPQSSTASTNVTQQPSVSIVKTVTSVGGVAGDPSATYAGEVIDYNIVVTNTGNETLTNVVVADTTLGTTLGTLASLAPGATVTYSASQTVTQADLNQILGTTSGCAGSVSHTAPGTGLGAGCTAWLSSTFNPTSCANGATYSFQGITCTISGKGVGSSPITEKCPNAIITFSNSCSQPTTVYNASTNCWVTTLPANSNPGSVFLSGLPLSVPSGCNFANATITWSIGQSSNNCGASSIAWDASCAGFNNFNQNGCNGLGNYNQIGVQACDNIGDYGNGSHGSGSFGFAGYGYGGWGSGWGSGQSSSSTCAGTPVNQYISGNCTTGSFSQGYGGNGSSGSCGATGNCNSNCGGSGGTTGSQTNVSGNTVINTATVTDSQGVTGSSTASTVVVAAAPGVSIVKSVTSVGGVAGDPAATYAGEVIDYSVVVSNTGNEALTNVVVTDTTLGTTLGTLASLAAGASVAYTTSQTVTQAEINSGCAVSNTATVSDSQTPSQSSTASTNITQQPGVSIVKTVTSVGGVAGDPAATTAGEVIDYQVVVTNTGNETLTNVVVADSTLGTTLGTLASLAPGATATYAVAQSVTQAEINQALGLTTTGCAGSVTHTAPSSGLGAGCTAWLSSTFNPISCANGATYTFQGISCTISGRGVGGSPITEQCPNAVVTFSSSCTQATTVYNASSNCWVTTLPANCSPGSVFLSGLPLSVPSGCNLANCSITWSIGQSSNNCGASSIAWDASCTGFNSFDQNGCNGLSNYNQIGVQSCDNDGGSGNTCAGTPVNQYTWGNCSSGSFSTGSGSSGSCGATGTCISTNVSGDTIINTATVTDSQGVTGSSTASTVVAALPNVAIAKTVTSVGGVAGDPAATAAGQVITYSVVVTNTGDETLTNVVVTDTSLGKTLGTLASLAAGASQTYTVSQTVTQAEIDNGGPINDTATVTDSQGVTQSSTASTNVTQSPGVSIVKSVTSVGGVAGDPAATYAGEVIDYNVVVTNTGNETLTNVVVKDTTLGTTLGTLASLAPGATATYTASQTVTQAELNSGGTLSNTATVTDNQTPSQSSTASTALSPPALSIVKTPSAAAVAPGGTLSDTFVITNTGSVTLTNVSFTDITNGNTATSFMVTDPNPLAPDASFTYTSPSVTVAVPAPTTGTPALGSLIDQELGAAGPANFRVLSLGGTNASTVALNLNASTVNGNVGVADTGKFTASVPNTVTGQAYVGTSVNTSGVQSPVSGKLVVADSLVTEAATAAFAAETYFAGLTPTLSASAFNNGNINKNITVTGTAGLNVVDLSSFSLSGGTLTLAGPAGTDFVFDVNGNISGTSGAIVLGSGLTADDVLFNVTNPSATVSLNVPVTMNAILLAANNAITEDAGVWTGEVIGGYNKTITLMSATTMKAPPAPPANATDVATATATAPGNATITASTSANTEVVPSGSGVTVNTGAPAAGTNLVTSYGNAAILEFVFNPCTTVSTQSQGNGTTIATATPISTSTLGLPSSPAFILISNSASDSPTAGTDYYEGSVTAGSQLYADATTTLAGVADGGAFSTAANADLYVHIFSSQAAFLAGQSAVQELRYDTSGTHGMSLNDTIGSLKLIGYVSTQGTGYLTS